jgi:DNA-directed RNA polymerase subunit RPC12/RpoP
VGLQVLIAGCSGPERARIERTVRQALGDRPQSGSWSVSLVKVGDQWSVSVDGPEAKFRGITLTTTEIQLPHAIKNALERPQTSPTTSTGVPLAAPSAPEQRDRHKCSHCGRAFVVIYGAQADEPKDMAPVACPHCWHKMQVPIAQGAVLTQEYRAEAT